MKSTREDRKRQVPKGVTRRQFLKSAGGISASILLAGDLCIGRHASAAVRAAREIRIGTFGPSHCAVPFVYAKLSRFFEEEGLNVDLINYPTMPLIAKDLIDGEIDFGQIIVPLALAIHTGAKPFKAPVPLAIPQITGTNGAAMMIRQGVNIKGPLDLKGKILANHSKLSVHFLINMMLLEGHGLVPDKDLNVKIVELGNVIDEVRNGAVDAVVMPEPKNAVMEAMGIASTFMMSRYIWPNHPCCALVTRQEVFKTDRGLVAAVTRAITRAGLMANNPDTREETVDMLRTSDKYNYNAIAREVLLRAFIPGRADFYPFPYQSSAMLIVDHMKKHGLLDHQSDSRALAESLFLSDFSRSIIEGLGEQAPHDNYRTEKILGVYADYKNK